ncbi:MAG: SRPBCC family protein [Gaiellaceae bacterium]
MTSELTEYSPPDGYAFRVVDGPVRALGKGRFDALGDARTRFTFELDFEGHGLGKLLVPLFVRRQAAKELPESHANLKKRLES